MVDLRRQLHEAKARDRMALQAQTSGSPMERFVKSEYMTGILTAVVVFIILYASNPYNVQQAAKNFEVPKPNLTRIALYSGLAGAIVAFGPMIVQKILVKK